MKIRQANKIVKRIFKITVLGPVSPFCPNWIRINYQKKECNCYSKNQREAAIRVICRYATSKNDVKKLLDLNSTNEKNEIDYVIN